MSKERLENIYKRLENTTIKLGRQNGKNQFVKDLNYLFEQAERVQELEEQLQGMHIIYDTRLAKSDEFEKQNKRYREAFLKIDDYDIELGDMREDLQEKLLQIKYIKDKALEESE